MPCEECGHLLCVEEPKKGEDSIPATLYCPRCNGLPLEFDSRVKLKTDWILEEHLSNERAIEVITRFRKRDLVFYLLWRLNDEISTFLDTAGMQFAEFNSVMYILKQVYGRSDFGEEPIQDVENPPDRIEDIVDGYTVVLRYIRDVRNGFIACVGRPERDLNWDGNKFIQDYDFYRTEYNHCFERCIRSVVGGREHAREDFEFVADNLRLADKTEPKDIETLRDFADCWYQIIVSLKFVAAADELANDVYYTDMPESLDVFQIEKFTEELTALTTDEEQAFVREQSALFELLPEWVERCGTTVFESKWPETKTKLIFSESTLDAHPFLFYLEYFEKRESPGMRTPVNTPRVGIIHQPNFARILKFQMFPLLQNGSNKSGHVLLSELTAERGTTYERKIFQYLRDKGIECYHDPEITRKNKNEIDLIVADDGKIWFVEIKFFMPTTSILTAEGVEVINEKFDYKIFKEDTERRHSSPSGRPFPEKVEAWTELDPGATFTSLVYSGEEERKEQSVKEEWSGLETEMLVVSNLVPSYIEKENVQFLTDVEFYKWIEKGESVFSKIRKPEP